MTDYREALYDAEAIEAAAGAASAAIAGDRDLVVELKRLQDTYLDTDDAAEIARRLVALAAAFAGITGIAAHAAAPYLEEAPDEFGVIRYCADVLHGLRES